MDCICLTGTTYMDSYHWCLPWQRGRDVHPLSPGSVVLLTTTWHTFCTKMCIEWLLGLRRRRGRLTCFPKGSSSICPNIESTTYVLYYKWVLMTHKSCNGIWFICQYWSLKSGNTPMYLMYWDPAYVLLWLFFYLTFSTAEFLLWLANFRSNKST